MLVGDMFVNNDTIVINYLGQAIRSLEDVHHRIYDVCATTMEMVCRRSQNQFLEVAIVSASIHVSLEIIE